ncbi:hypothetical protein O2W18_21410 [Modestobacter sp. VKM Ac-2983]|uniref:hypothetical protein n=1 Tax=Modestobacter sp. VKM Ac-2983 TaxID=3004137 RepID=UPI0022ABB519|nr:hypothetical protein [Modestobacter sp. VKM Ac-2983]MCZ2807673.1 hypothetical protein [Modestobacter sp. VKM Ac-2983]
MIEALDAIAEVPDLVESLRTSGLDLGDLIKARNEMDSIHRVSAQAIRLFAPLGWAPSGAMPMTPYAAAIASLASDGKQAAEQILVEAWDNEHRLRRPVQQISVLGHPEEDYRNLFRQRSLLLGKALTHHQTGAYEASIPIVLAQIEGLVADVTGGKLFFSRNPSKAADVVDASAIATQHEALPVVRDYFSAGMDYTASEGSLSRHGILHGRDLGYATRINSVKAFVLLQALVEWAQPLVQAEVAARKAAREATWAGSDEVDELGRRRDAREFLATRLALRYLHSCQMGWHNQLGRYRDDLLPLVESHFVKDGLPAAHGIVMHVQSDGQSWWAWRQTISGWCLGTGAVGPTPSQWFYDAPVPPRDGPNESPEAWGGREHAVLPNWQSG